MVDKENTIRARLDQIEVDIRPEMIERSVAVVGTLRPEECEAGEESRFRKAQSAKSAQRCSSGSH